MRSGFSIIKNGERFGFPWKESLRSLAPLVDEIEVAHGDSGDGTGAALEKLRGELPCPLRVIDSPWDPKAQRGGLELSRQSNIALDHCTHDICFYLQGDEVLHEEDYPLFRRDLERLEKDAAIDALAFAWLHFYGNFSTLARSRRWYRREVRAFKRSRGLRSFGDAQGFRIPNESTAGAENDRANVAWTKPRAALSAARVLHYGWVRPPQVMAQKSESFDRLWHGDAREGSHTEDNVYPMLFGMRPFTGRHPALMAERVTALGDFDPFRGHAPAPRLKNWRYWLGNAFEDLTGLRPGEYRNYKISADWTK